jgi:hypothetical protein
MASPCKISQKQREAIMADEIPFCTTIKRNESLSDLIKTGIPYTESSIAKLVQLSTSAEYNEAIFMDDWFRPAGAFRNGWGPS